MKRTIILSLLLVSVAALLMGLGTFAYFSDTASSTGNVFTAGTMDFRITDPGTTDHKMFNLTNMKPGDSSTAYLAVVNDSSAGIGMKWHAWVDGWASGILDDVLEVRVTMGPAGYNYVPLKTAAYTIAGPSDYVITDWTPITNLANGNVIFQWAGLAGAFEPAWAAVYQIDVRMKSDAGNAYQGASFIGDINFAATQYENTGW